MKAFTLEPNAQIPMESIVQLVMDCSPMPDMDQEQTARDLTDFIRSERNVFVIVKSDAVDIVGFCGVTPHDWAVRELIAQDQQMRSDPERYYFDMIGVRREYWRSGAFLHLMCRSLEVCLEKGIRNFSSHSLITTGINRTVKKLFSHCTGHRILPDWMGSGEPYEYLEFTVYEKDILRIRRLLKM